MCYVTMGASPNIPEPWEIKELGNIFSFHILEVEVLL